MIKLCDLVVQSLEKRELSCRIFHPHTFMKGNQADFKADLTDVFKFSEFKNVIPVLHGDVVDVMGSAQFGILSGDHIAERLVKEAFQLRNTEHYGSIHMIFAMTGAPGLMSHPPEHPESVLIQNWHPGDKTTGLKHNSSVRIVYFWYPPSGYKNGFYLEIKSEVFRI